MSMRAPDPRLPLPDPQQESFVQRIRQQVQAHPNLVALLVAAAGIGIAIVAYRYYQNNIAGTVSPGTTTNSGDTTSGTGGTTGGTTTTGTTSTTPVDTSGLQAVVAGLQSQLSALQSAVTAGAANAGFGNAGGQAAAANAPIQTNPTASPPTPSTPFNFQRMLSSIIEKAGMGGPTAPAPLSSHIILGNVAAVGTPINTTPAKSNPSILLNQPESLPRIPILPPKVGVKEY